MCAHRVRKVVRACRVGKVVYVCGAGEGCGGVVWDSVVWHGVVLICGVWLSFNPSKPLSLSGRFVASALLNMFFLLDSILASMVLARFL